MTDVAKLLREAREKSGLSIRGLAEKSGVGKSTIARWEQGAYLPDIPELRRVMKSLDAREEDIREACSLIPKPRARAIAPTFEFAGDLLRALRHRQATSLEEAAHSLGISKTTLCKYENGDRKPDAETLRRIASLLHASQEELSAIGQAVESESPRADSEVRFNKLIEGTQRGQTPLDLEFLSLEAELRRHNQRELLTRVRATYIEWLGWWYRAREAGMWAERQVGDMAANRHLPIWGRVIRARNVSFSEYGPKEPVVRIQVLRHAIETLAGTPNEAFIRRELAGEFIGLGFMRQALDQLEHSRNAAKTLEDRATHIFCCDMIEGHAWLSVGQIDRAHRLLTECPPNDPYLKVSSTVGRSRILVAAGREEQALRELQEVHQESRENGFPHFARTARSAMDAIERLSQTRPGRTYS
jgi:transcriptional regulator with XRE-family HTH domain